MRTYSVKEIFLSLQGEGAQAGRAAVFLRFAGCNLWSGREADRAEAQCRFCDTDFVDGEKIDGADAVAARVAALWPAGQGARLVIATGGEPALQLDAELVEALHKRGFQVAVETNGTLALPDRIDWVCVSPKAGTELKVVQGDELKLVFPQADLDPDIYEYLGFTHFLLQPMDGPDREANTASALRHCLTHPRWRLSLQTHKIIGIP